jgi:hypothetical protein
VNCLLFKNPTGDLASVEDKLPGPPYAEAGEAALQVTVPHGPGGTPEEPTNLVNRKRLAQRIVVMSMAYGFSYGQLCPRRIGPNAFALPRFCFFCKLDLCHLDRPYCSRTVCVRSVRNELTLTGHRDDPFSSVPDE